MSSTAPIDLTAALIIERIESGEYPPEVQQTIAAGYLPLAQEDLIAVLAYLAKKAADATLAGTARRSLTDLPTRSMVAFASDEGVAPEHLARLAGATDDTTIIESLIRNRALSDDLVAEIAANADAAVQDVVVTNQLRILRSPKILEALLANPRLTPDVRRRALETREEFFEKRTAQPQPPAEEIPDDDEAIAEDLPLDAIADLLLKAQAEDAAGVPSEPPAIKIEDPTKMSVFSRVLKMSVSEKVQLAFKGGKTERSILIRDRNKLVCSACIRNPRMNDSEVEAIAGMRNVDEEVLRLIAMRREWMAKYPIINALIRNPKAPIGVVLPLINRLTLRDLKGLKDDKGVSEVVRSMSRKLFTQRSLKS